jgi:hypothetical protein
VLGKPIDRITIDDLQRLIADAIPEGRHLEFKKDVPVSNEEQKRQRKAGVTEPFDQKVKSGTGITPFGRDSLLEELVAFANADGGMIVLGMDQTKQHPPRAKSLELLPHVANLERSLQDAIIDCVEPRLPYATVRAIELAADGSGVILMEAQPSTLGPHWVRTTSNATVRRVDRCDTLSMPEIHDMVLQKSRRFDEVTRALSEARERFEQHLLDTGHEMQPQKQQHLDNWLGQEKLALIGLRVTVVPHQSLGLARLERVDDLEPRGGIACDPALGRTKSFPITAPPPQTARRVLGGVVTSLDGANIKRRVMINRDGHVEAAIVICQQTGRPLYLGSILLCAGWALGYYENLRVSAGAPVMPAEVAAEILAKGDCRPALTEDYGAHEGAPLQFRTSFPLTTVSAFSDFHEYLTALAGDFANAGGLSADYLPRFSLEIRRT